MNTPGSNILQAVGFGGGCHWCTEAVFASLKGVAEVKQGWIAALPPKDSFSEAVLVNYNTDIINLEELILVHLSTHASSSDHVLRDNYRSAVYCFNEADYNLAATALHQFNGVFNKPLVTQVLMFDAFKENSEVYLNYYYSNPEKAFCKTHIQPKLDFLKEKFASIYKK